MAASLTAAAARGVRSTVSSTVDRHALISRCRRRRRRSEAVAGRGRLHAAPADPRAVVALGRHHRSLRGRRRRGTHEELCITLCTPGRVQEGVAPGETVILLHPPSTFSRCFNSDGERASAI